jgi:hypothetical protein
MIGPGGTVAGFKKFVSRLTEKPQVKGGSATPTSGASKAKSTNKSQQR